MCIYVSWTVKKAESRRIDAFELWCWRRFLRVPWTARRCNQSILKEISPGISLEGMMLKLKLQYFGHHMCRIDHWKRVWCWEGLGAGGEGDDRGWDGWMASLTRWTWVWVNSGSYWWTGKRGVLRFMGSQRVGHDWATQQNWTELKPPFSSGYSTPCNISFSSLTDLQLATRLFLQVHSSWRSIPQVFLIQRIENNLLLLSHFSRVWLCATP